MIWRKSNILGDASGFSVRERCHRAGFGRRSGESLAHVMLLWLLVVGHSAKGRWGTRQLQSTDIILTRRLHSSNIYQETPGIGEKTNNTTIMFKKELVRIEYRIPTARVLTKLPSPSPASQPAPKPKSSRPSSAASGKRS